jgi:endonuclease/exonuclease/phosphatase family metal-dependent hydrolase
MHGSTSSSFTYLNTHLDDQSDAQRKLGASLLLTRSRYEAVKTNGPVLITGDFNSPQAGNYSGAYAIITGQQPALPINATFARKYDVPNGELPDFRFLDMKATTPRFGVTGNFATYTDWSKPGDTASWTRIDFVFGGSNGGWSVTQYHRYRYNV